MITFPKKQLNYYTQLIKKHVGTFVLFLNYHFLKGHLHTETKQEPKQQPTSKHHDYSLSNLAASTPTHLHSASERITYGFSYKRQNYHKTPLFRAILTLEPQRVCKTSDRDAARRLSDWNGRHGLLYYVIGIMFQDCACTFRGSPPISL